MCICFMFHLPVLVLELLVLTTRLIFFARRQVLHGVRVDRRSFGLRRHRHTGGSGVQWPSREGSYRLRRMPAVSDEETAGNALSRPRRRAQTDSLEGRHHPRVPRPLGDEVPPRRLPLRRSESDQLHSRLVHPSDCSRNYTQRRQKTGPPWVETDVVIHLPDNFAQHWQIFFSVVQDNFTKYFEDTRSEDTKYHLGEIRSESVLEDTFAFRPTCSFARLCIVRLWISGLYGAI